MKYFFDSYNQIFFTTSKLSIKLPSNMQPCLLICIQMHLSICIRCCICRLVRWLVGQFFLLRVLLEKHNQISLGLNETTNNGAVFRTTFSPIVSGVFPYFFLSEKSLNLEAKNFEKSFSMRAPPPTPSLDQDSCNYSI